MPITIYPGSVKKRNANGTYTDLIPGADNNPQLVNDLAAEYDAVSGIYSVGDYCTYQSVFHRCITAISTPEAFNSSKWSAVPVGDELNVVKDSVTSEAATRANADTVLHNTLNSEIATRQTYVRPNLLDNWYFGNPVNQREQTSYSNVGYTIDRWRITSSSVLVNIATGLVVTNQDSNARRQIGQFYENPSNLYGKTVTGSILLSNGEMYYGTITVPVSPPSDTVQYFSFADFSGNTLRISFETSGRIEFTLMVAARSSVSVLAMKLELGSGQTLAHNEGTDANPVWVLNEIPEYGEELRKCQRYYYELTGGTSYGTVAFGAYKDASNSAVFIFNNIEVMRRQPNVAISGEAGINSTSFNAATYKYKETYYGKATLLTFTAGSNIARGTPAILQDFGNNNLKITFSAEP